MESPTPLVERERERERVTSSGNFLRRFFSIISQKGARIPTPALRFIGLLVGLVGLVGLYRPAAQAVVGTLEISGTSQTLTGDVTAGRLVDQANSAYLIDPAASGTSLTTAGKVAIATTSATENFTVAGNIGFTGGGKIKDNAGQLQLQAGGTGTGSTGTGSIYFLNSSGTTRARIDTAVGVSSTEDPVNATGGTITYSGGYTIHTFTSSGTFTPGTAGNVEYLVVAGGGGGGGAAASSNGPGGGGAGGFRTGTGFAVTAQAYTITVGAGGAGGAASSTGVGTQGNNSVFSTITAVGGGGGAAESSAPTAGGSGGGGSGQVASGLGGSGTSGQGYAGGSAENANYRSGGGEGGASQVGYLGVAGGGTGYGGAGGAGTASSISGSSVTYAGGGGAGGSPGVAGTANTGGGGGAGNNSYAGGNGGSGIVIVRYPTTNYSTLYLGSTNTSSQDLAEYYVSGDSSIDAGDVVIISQKSKVKSQNGEDINTKGVLMKAEKAYDSKLIGIISTNPGVLMGSIDGENKEDKRMLALAGRVPVKIDPDSPAIAVGDFLTSGSRPGLAAKATRPGYVVGRALESWKPGGPDRIEAFIQLSYYMGDIDEHGDFRNLEVDTLKVNKTLEVGGVNVMDEINYLKRRLEVLERK